MIIGNFKREGDSYIGTIQTLAFQANAAFDPADRKSENSPDYRVTAGHAEIGVAWKETSEAGNAYLSVQLDGPGLPAPVKCVLLRTESGHGHSLVWDRPRRRP